MSFSQVFQLLARKARRCFKMSRSVLSVSTFALRGCRYAAQIDEIDRSIVTRWVCCTIR